MPWAGDNFTLQLSFAEWSATMQAGVQNGIEGSVHVGDREGTAVNLEFTDGPRGDFIFSRGTQKCHFRKPPISYSKDAALKGGATTTTRITRLER
jgi:hypothetical protein